MKRIRELDGQRVAFLEEEDIRTLLECRSFVRPELFLEPALANLEFDEQGFYVIREPENVAYIENLGYIVDYDMLSALTPEELNNLANKTMVENNKVRDIVVKLCEIKEKLTFKERRVLKKSGVIDSYCRNCIEENVLNASGERVRFREMSDALLAQLRNHTNAIIKMADGCQLENRHVRDKK